MPSAAVHAVTHASPVTSRNPAAKLLLLLLLLLLLACYARCIPEACPAGAWGYWRVQCGAVTRRGAGSGRTGEGADGEAGGAAAACRPFLFLSVHYCIAPGIALCVSCKLLYVVDIPGIAAGHLATSHRLRSIGLAGRWALPALISSCVVAPACCKTGALCCTHECRTTPLTWAKSPAAPQRHCLLPLHAAGCAEEG
jgi:hypothetical protein